jgi:uncharacterized OB-fold protein
MSGPTSATAEAPRLLPRPSPESKPFWDACARHELHLQRCASCGQFWFPPANRCQHCWSDRFAWTPVSGRGEVHTFTVYHRAYAPELAERLPYIVAIVALEEGPRLISNVADCEPSAVRVGMPVEVVFSDISQDVSVHAFRPERT